MSDILEKLEDGEPIAIDIVYAQGGWIDYDEIDYSSLDDFYIEQEEQ